MRRFPDWVLKQREKGTAVYVRNDKYYLYKVKSVWDREKGRPKKVTGEYLGRLTPEGLVRPRHERLVEGITVKEFGATEYVLSLCSDVVERLKKHYPGEWDDIVVFSIARLFYASPMKNVYHHYITSHLSDAFPEASASPKPLSDLLYSIGLGRQQAVDFMKEFVVEGGEFLAFDSTHVFSLSEDVIAATLGHNSEEEYVPQLNLSLIFSLDRMHPSFFRIVPGSVRDVSVIPASVREAGISNATVVTDKGFYSEANVLMLEGEGLRYVMPLRRNSSLVSYRRLSGDMKKLDGFFQFDERAIWHYTIRSGRKKKVVVYFDPSLKAEEEKDFLSRVSEGKAKIEEYYERQRILGTISVITDVEEGPEAIFQLLKSRVDVEQLFDTLKNTLHADRTYMRDDHHMQGWMFVNFVAMLFYYRLYSELMAKKLLRKYSPHDVIVHLSRIQKLLIGGRWILSEVPKTSREISEKLGFEPMAQIGRS